MPKVIDPNTGKVYDVEWNRDTDPTQQEMAALIAQARTKQIKTEVEAESPGGTLGAKVGRAINWMTEPIESIKSGIEAVTPESGVGKTALSSILSNPLINPGALSGTFSQVASDYERAKEAYNKSGIGGLFEPTSISESLQSKVPPSAYTPSPIDLLTTIPAAGEAGMLGKAGRLASGAAGTAMIGAGLKSGWEGDYGPAAMQLGFGALGLHGARTPKTMPGALAQTSAADPMNDMLVRAYEGDPKFAAMLEEAEKAKQYGALIRGSEGAYDPLLQQAREAKLRGGGAPGTNWTSQRQVPGPPMDKIPDFGPQLPPNVGGIAPRNLLAGEHLPSEAPAIPDIPGNLVRDVTAPVRPKAEMVDLNAPGFTPTAKIPGNLPVRDPVTGRMMSQKQSDALKNQRRLENLKRQQGLVRAKKAKATPEAEETIDLSGVEEPPVSGQPKIVAVFRDEAGNEVIRVQKADGTRVDMSTEEFNKFDQAGGFRPKGPGSKGGAGPKETSIEGKPPLSDEEIKKLNDLTIQELKDKHESLTAETFTRINNMATVLFDRLKKQAAEITGEPGMLDLKLQPKYGVAGEYSGTRGLKTGKKNLETIFYDPKEILLRSGKDPDKFANELVNVLSHELAHESGLHAAPKLAMFENSINPFKQLSEEELIQQGAKHLLPSLETQIEMSGGKKAVVPIDTLVHDTISMDRRIGVNPEEHRFQTVMQSIQNHPETFKLKAALAANLKRNELNPLDLTFAEAKHYPEGTVTGGDETAFPKGVMSPEIVAEKASLSGGKNVRIEGNRVSWTAASGEERSVEVGKDRIGSRLFEENPRALGTNPRAIGTNPRSPLTSLLGKLAPEVPESTKQKWTKETGALLVGPKTPPPTPGQKVPRKATFGEKFADVTNISRTIKSAIDFSMPLRQGGLFVARHPMMALKAAKKMWGSAWSEKYYEDVALDVIARAHKNNNRYLDAGLALTMHPRHASSKNLFTREEAFLSTIPERIPGIGGLIRGSNRAAVAFLNQARMDTFDHLAAKFKDAKIPVPDKDIAKYVNIITGRAGLGKLGERIQPVLQGMLFSPRFLASRVQSITHMIPGTGLLDPRLQKELGKAWAGYATAIGGVLGAAKVLGGAEVEVDPRSPNFLKIKFGKTHIDIGGSYPQLAQFFYQMYNPERKLEGSGYIIKAGGRTSGPLKRRMEVGGRFLRSKLNPPVGLLPTVWSKENFIQQPFDEKNPWHWAREGTNLLSPMYPSDLASSIKEYGPALGTAVSIPSLVGGNVNIYDPMDRSRLSRNKFQEDVMSLWNNRFARDFMNEMRKGKK